MNTSSDTEIHPLVRDLRVHWFKAGEYYLREGSRAAVEITSTAAGPPAPFESPCHITVVVIPYGPPKASADAVVAQETLAGAHDAVEFARRSPHPRVRAAAEIAAANLAIPPERNLRVVEVDFWVQDGNQEWREGGRQRLTAEGQAHFHNVPRAVNCWIEFLAAEPGRDPLTQGWEDRGTREQRMPAKRSARRDRELAEPPAGIVQRGMFQAAPAAGESENAPQPRRLQRANTRRFELENLTAEVGLAKDRQVWLTIHTNRQALQGATVRFRFGPVIGAVELQAAGPRCEGICRLNLPAEELPRLLQRFAPEFFVGSSQRDLG